MAKRYHFFLALVVLSLIYPACRKKSDETRVNLPPETYLEVDTIVRSGDNRLTSSVRLRWSGSDADGFVKGYQIVWGSVAASDADWANARLLTNTDSTFLFGFPEGAIDTTDIVFSVRAVDNRNQADPNPARVIVPIKNNPPTVEISNTTFPAGDSILHVFSLRYSANDPDGPENLKSIYFRANNGNWIELPKNSTFLTLVPEYVNNSYTGITKIFLGENLATRLQQPAPYTFTLNGIVPGAENRFFFKTFDQAGDSAIAETPQAWFMIPKQHDFLVLDSYRGSIQPQPETVYFPLLNMLTSGFDYIDFNAPYRNTSTQFLNTTLYLFLNQYKTLFWYGDVPQVIEESINSFEQYLRFNGKAIFVSTFPTVPRVERDSPLFPFLAVDSVTWRPASLRTDAKIDSLAPGYRSLELLSADIVDGVDFLFPRLDSDTLYSIPRSSLRSAPVYTGQRLVATRRKNQANNRTNLVFFSIDLHRFGRKPGTIQATLNHIINEEFNW